MNAPPDFRPMQWNCQRDRRCWLRRCQPRFEVFADCFPGRASLTDVDTSIERNGYFLLVEFKALRSLPQGQRLYLEHQPPEYLVAVAVCPDCRTMEVTELAVRRNGRLGPFEPASLERLRCLMRRWWQWAERQPPTRAVRRLP